MPVYDIAGVKVFMEPKHETTVMQSEKYKIDDVEKKNADVFIDYPEADIEMWRKIAPHFTEDTCEYMAFGAAFYKELIKYNGILLHSSAIVYEGKAYLFSATSGTGKSTHTGLWLKYFGEENAYILNDDKPAIRKIDGAYYACGTPFSGKYDMSRNVVVPLRAICFLKRGKENTIRQLETDEAVYAIMNQTIRNLPKENMLDLLDMTGDILKNVPAYELKCNISEEAVKVAYERMR